MAVDKLVGRLVVGGLVELLDAEVRVRERALEVDVLVLEAFSCLLMECHKHLLDRELFATVFLEDNRVDSVDPFASVGATFERHLRVSCELAETQRTFGGSIQLGHEQSALGVPDDSVRTGDSGCPRHANGISHCLLLRLEELGQMPTWPSRPRRGYDSI